MSALPPCRHRREQVGVDQWRCDSPKIVLPTGVVNSRDCQERCPFVDHEDSPPVQHPGPWIPWGEAVNVTPVPGRFAIAVLTAPRTERFVDQTLDQLRNAGFDQHIYVFEEPGTAVAPRENISVLTNPHRLGIWPNWLNVASWMLCETREPFILICEDDILLRSDAALALEYAVSTLPHHNFGVASLFTPWANLNGYLPLGGWCPLDLKGKGWGAQTYCLSRTSLRALVEACCASPPHPNGLTDIIVTRVMQQLGRICYTHLPSLAAHAAEGISTWNRVAEHGMQAVQFDPAHRQYHRVDASLTDCYGLVEIRLPEPRPHAERCIATVVSAGFAQHLDDLFGSVNLNADCPDALQAVFLIDEDEACRRVAQKYGAIVIECTKGQEATSSVSAVLQSAPRVIDAKWFLCLDADMVVLGSLRDLFVAVQVARPGSVLVARDLGFGTRGPLGRVLGELYGGLADDFERLCGRPELANYPLIANSGLYAGSAEALLALDNTIRRFRDPAGWMAGRPELFFRDQFLFNLALADLNCGVEIDPAYNVQLMAAEVAPTEERGRWGALWAGREAKVLHFNGPSRYKFRTWKGRFASAEPLPPPGEDWYAHFVRCMRDWIARHGSGILGWSFHTSLDGRKAHCRDWTTFPLFGTLYYLIRANGCLRVLESGTGYGISSGVMACALADRPDAQVVTLDNNPQRDRRAFWATLPVEATSRIVQRVGDSLALMRQALEAGERYEAVLLDSCHTPQHVWAEFELAVQLVCPRGLILIHDVNHPYFGLSEAVARIEAAGYGVTKLWSASAGIPQDSGAGLAVIENRQRTQGSISV